MRTAAPPEGLVLPSTSETTTRPPLGPLLTIVQGAKRSVSTSAMSEAWFAIGASRRGPVS